MSKQKHAAATVLLLAVSMAALLTSSAPVEDLENGEYGMNAVVPAVTGSFIQPWLCDGWTVDRWGVHLDMLLSACIRIVIVQWTAETPDGEFATAGFPVPDGWTQSAGGLRCDAHMMERLLDAAEKRNMQVYVGLNTAEEWWGNAFLQPEWCEKQAETGNLVAKELYDLYKGKYPNAFHGWYWAWEMYGNRSGYEKNWSAMMNISLDGLSAIDEGMPLLFSPFLSGYLRLTPTQEEAMWTGFFNTARLRQGDIFCPQDSVGAAGFTMKYVDSHLAAMKRAAETRPGLVFWVNNENFTSDFKPAPLQRFVRQLIVSGKHTDTHVCFSYSHYYSPDIVDPAYDSQYKAMLAGAKPDGE
jgi:hypothetical protein